ncbi:hypothetical protein FALCPG4_19024 [Fusarium falciforme]
MEEAHRGRRGTMRGAKGVGRRHTAASSMKAKERQSLYPSCRGGLSRLVLSSQLSFHRLSQYAQPAVVRLLSQEPESPGSLTDGMACRCCRKTVELAVLCECPRRRIPLQSHSLSIESAPSGSWVLAGSDVLFMDHHHSNRGDMPPGLARLRRRGTRR